MKIASSQTRWLAQVSTRKVLRRASGTAAVLAVLAAAIGVPVMSPEPDAGSNPVLAIARADCPPDCGGPGNGGTPSGPPGGGTEFVPPSIPAMPSYDPGRGQPPLDQNNGISIYNSAAPQPSQAAQPSQAPVQNQDGSYNRAANGEQQPINYNKAPNNQGINQDWQNLSSRLNQNPDSQSGQQQPAQNNGQPDQSSEQLDRTTTRERCDNLFSQLNHLSDTASPDGSNFQDIFFQMASIATDLAKYCGITAGGGHDWQSGACMGWNYINALPYAFNGETYLEFSETVRCMGDGWQPKKFDVELQEQNNCIDNPIIPNHFCFHTVAQQSAPSWEYYEQTTNVSDRLHCPSPDVTVYRLKVTLDAGGHTGQFLSNEIAVPCKL